MHGPRCIEVAAALLEDEDPRIRLGAVNALLDRGFGKPAQTIAATSDIPTLQFQHLVAARAFSDELARERAAAENGKTINAKAEQPLLTMADLMRPALE